MNKDNGDILKSHQYLLISMNALKELLDAW